MPRLLSEAVGLGTADALLAPFFRFRSWEALGEIMGNARLVLFAVTGASVISACIGSDATLS